MDEQPDILILPIDATLVKQLQSKLFEYNQRIIDHRTEHPDLNNNVVLDSTYKGFVLATLLRVGTVNSHNISMEMYKRFKSFDVDLFNRCYGVVKSYVENTGDTVSGTGLNERDFEQSKLEEIIDRLLN